jgi:hypothetical protein
LTVAALSLEATELHDWLEAHTLRREAEKRIPRPKGAR